MAKVAHQRATWGDQKKEFLEKTTLQAAKGAKESKNDPNMVPFWSQIGPKMVPLATQNLDNCVGGPTKVDV